MDCNSKGGSYIPNRNPMSHVILELPGLTTYKGLAVLIENVTNQVEIKENLISGNLQYDYSFINAENIVSMEQLYSSFYKSINNEHHQTLKAKTLHTEMIYALAPFKNIMDCLNKFGISKTANNVIVLKIAKSEEFTDSYVNEQLESIQKIVKGTIIDLDDSHLQNNLDVKKIEKNYKIKITGTDLEGNWDKVNRNLICLTQLKGL